MPRIPREPLIMPPSGCEFIYALLCPDTGRVVYVGRTGGVLVSRIRAHFWQRTLDKNVNPAFCEWKRGLLSRGQFPGVRVLAVPSRKVACLVEREWTQHYKEMGSLYNVQNMLADSEKKVYVKKISRNLLQF